MAFTPAEFAAIKFGQRVGVVDGPGQSAKNNAGTIKRKVETEWGYSVEVEMDEDRNGPRLSCSGFTKVGIGWYLLDTPAA